MAFFIKQCGMWHLSSYKSVLASLDFSRSPKSSQRQRWARNQTEKAKRLSVDWLMCFSLRRLRRLRAYSASSPGHSYLFECFTFLGLWQPQAHLYRCYPSPPFPDCSAVFSNTLLLSLPDGILFAHFGFYGKKQTAIPYSSATAVKMEAFCDIKKHMLCSAQAAHSLLCTGHQLVFSNPAQSWCFPCADMVQLQVILLHTYSQFITSDIFDCWLWVMLTYSWTEKIKFGVNYGCSMGKYKIKIPWKCTTKYSLYLTPNRSPFRCDSLCWQKRRFHIRKHGGNEPW